jgi:MFS superfamily sulfate permease-like transporter
MVPVLRWLPSYDKSWLKFDLIAGLTLAAFAIPDNMAYATLAWHLKKGRTYIPL